MNYWRTDPGECIVCGAAHCACGPGGPIAIDQLATADSGAIAIEQLPTAAKTAAAKAVAAATPLKADIVQATLPPGHFTTGTYRGTKRGLLPKR